MNVDKTSRIGTCAENEQVENTPVKDNFIKDNYVLTEKDFYPPEDDRYLISGIDDIEGGDNFVDYTEYYFDTYIEEDWMVAI